MDDAPRGTKRAATEGGGESRREGRGEWREKWSAMEVDVGFDGAKKEIRVKVKRRRGPARTA